MLLTREQIERNKEFIEKIRELLSSNHEGKAIELNSPLDGDTRTLLVPMNGDVQVWSKIYSWSWPYISEYDQRLPEAIKQVENGEYSWVVIPE